MAFADIHIKKEDKLRFDEDLIVTYNVVTAESFSDSFEFLVLPPDDVSESTVAAGRSPPRSRLTRTTSSSSGRMAPSRTAT